LRNGSKKELERFSAHSTAVCFFTPLLVLQLRIRWKSQNFSSDFSQTAPALGSDGMVYVTGRGDVSGAFAFVPFDGTLRWKFLLPNDVQAGPIAVDDSDDLYFGTNNGLIFALNHENGALKWQFSSYGDCTSIPLVFDGVLIIPCNAVNSQFYTSYLHFLDVNTGRQVYYDYSMFGGWFSRRFDSVLFCFSSPVPPLPPQTRDLFVVAFSVRLTALRCVWALGLETCLSRADRLRRRNDLRGQRFKVDQYQTHNLEGKQVA
jgi:outer membrane protein assembly factor BamB